MTDIDHYPMCQKEVATFVSCFIFRLKNVSVWLKQTDYTRLPGFRKKTERTINVRDRINRVFRCHDLTKFVTSKLMIWIPFFLCVYHFRYNATWSIHGNKLVPVSPGLCKVLNISLNRIHLEPGKIQWQLWSWPAYFSWSWQSVTMLNASVRRLQESLTMFNQWQIGINLPTEIQDMRFG